MAKPPKLGNVNAFGLAKLFDANGKLVGHCADTPNCIAAAFVIIKKADIVQYFMETKSRNDYADRFRGLDLELFRGAIIQL